MKIGLGLNGKLVAAVVCALVGGSGATLAQVISPRAIAASGTAEPATPIWETHLAVGTTGGAGQDVLALFNTWFGYADPGTVGYAYWNGTVWSEDQIKVDDGNGNPNDDTTDGHQVDPVVHFDGLAQTFTCLAMNDQSGQNRLAVAHFDAGDPSAVRWRDFWPTDHNPYYLDKPWLVPGENYGGQREYYVLATYERVDDNDPTRQDFAYMRSIDGGQTWYGEQIVLPLVQARGRWIWPAVVDDGPLYAACAENYGATGTRVRFLIGVDDNTDPQEPRVSFSRLQCGIGGGFNGLDGFGDSIDLPVQNCLQVLINRRNVQDLVPGGFLDKVYTIPQLAADPTDPNRLYLVYHDTDPEAPSDVNVYLTSLVYSGGQWTALPRVKVNNDGNAATDQFLPSIVVDDFGVIHVIFYDDRRYVQGDSAPDAKYDVWYARSVDGGTNFEDNIELWGLSGLPALDETTASTNLRKPGEYIGITYFPPLDQVWTSYGGTSLFDPSNEQTVIWSSKIQQ
ncbi:MAG: hypothetical protein ACF8NJ_09315 [Phycisphaerales bacterium JB038]